MSQWYASDLNMTIEGIKMFSFECFVVDQQAGSFHAQYKITSQTKALVDEKVGHRHLENNSRPFCVWGYVVADGQNISVPQTL